jgi:hypothetical protein
MRRLLALACVVFAAPAVADEPLRVRMRLEPIAGRHQAYLDELRRAEHTVTTVAEQAQHLGSPYRSWLWVTPVVGGGTYGVVFRVDVR